MAHDSVGESRDHDREQRSNNGRIARAFSGRRRNESCKDRSRGALCCHAWIKRATAKLDEGITEQVVRERPGNPDRIESASCGTQAQPWSCRIWHYGDYVRKGDIELQVVFVYIKGHPVLSPDGGATGVTKLSGWVVNSWTTMPP